MTSAGPGQNVPVERLEVEDEEERQTRLHSTLQRLNVGSSNRVNNPAPTLPTVPQAEPDPASSADLLARVQAFLPQLEASNADLLRRAAADPRSTDIEHVSHDQAQYVQMDLGLGVFEAQNENAAPEAQGLGPGPSARTRTSSSGSSPSDDASSSGTSSDSDDTDSESNSSSSNESDSNSDSDSSDSESNSDSDADDPSRSPAMDVIAGIIARASRPVRPLPRRAGQPAPVILTFDDTVDTTESDQQAQGPVN